MNIDEYKQNPCRLSAIPYWKSKSFKIPNNLSIVHDDEYMSDLNTLSVDKLYFRLKHDLKSVEEIHLDDIFKYRNVNSASKDDLNEVADIINKCYTDVKVNLEQVIGWTKSEVFNKNLWIFIVDTTSKRPVALGIAEVDKEVNEGMLEWIQVLPKYRGIKLGQAIVTKLLLTLSNYVDFVTVSGQVDNKTNPERLYRRCGFEGNDIWHITERIES